MFIFIFEITTPDPQNIFNCENNNRNDIEIMKKLFFALFIMQWRNGFQHNRNDIENNQNNDKNIDDFITEDRFSLVISKIEMKGTIP